MSQAKLALRLLALLAMLSAGRAEALLTICSVTAVPVAFGNYDALSSANVDSTGSVTVSCLNILLPFSYTISLSSGGAGGFSPRQMSLLTNHLNYNLYSDSARSTIWGDGTGGTSTFSDSSNALLGGSKTYTVYGRIFGSQNVSAGLYTDSLVVTVTY